MPASRAGSRGRRSPRRSSSSRAGLLLGSEGFGWIGLSSTGEQVRVLAELTLTLVLFADASRIDLSALRREYTVPARLLGIGLPLTILAGWALGVALFGSLNWAEVLILAVILAPTDAALGQAVATDPRLPSRIRQGLNAESGLNDGICVPLLSIGLALAEAETGSASNHAALALVVEAIGYGVLFGSIAGLIGALVSKLARRHGLMDSAWGQILPVPPLRLPTGSRRHSEAAALDRRVCRRLRIRCTPAATPWGRRPTSWTSSAEPHEWVPTSIVFGAAIVGPVLSDLTWRAALDGRPEPHSRYGCPPVAVSLLGPHARRPTLAFVGWSGRRGLASIVFTIIVLEDGGSPHASTIKVAVVFTISPSPFTPMFSRAQPLTDRYASWYRAHPKDRLPSMESVHASHHPWRRSPRTADAGTTSS